MILVNNPGSWGNIYPPLKHAPWHGLTPTDLVFPFFLFAVGNAMAFVMPKLEAAGDAAFWKKVTIRSMLIFGIGLFLAWWPFVKWQNDELVFRPWSYVDDHGMPQGVRLLGVLARIAICYFFASIIIYYLKLRKAIYVGMVLLLLYWLLCYALGDPIDPYGLAGWFGTEFDKKVLGVAHMYQQEKLNGVNFTFDPEGLASTLPAIVQVIFGYMVGDYIRKKIPGDQMKERGFEMITGLFVAGVAFMVAGYCWDLVFPINKKIWTSSYVVCTTGMAMTIIATMIYFIELKNKRGWLSKFFDVFGKNALFVFALSAFLPRGLGLIRIDKGVNPWNWLYVRGFKNLPGDPRIGSLLYALCVISFMWLICWWMDKKKIYVKV